MGHHHFDGVLLPDFIDGLIAAGLHAAAASLPPPPRNDEEPFQLQPQRPLTIMRMVRRLNQALDESMVVIADPGDALFATSDLVIRRQTEYLSPAYYTSMGFAVPAALGVMVARPDLRAVVLVGDGAFQMTGMELSSIVRYGYSPIIIVLDNKSYATEALLQSGQHRYNDVHPWQYHKLPEVLGGGAGYEVRTEAQFDAALWSALTDPSGPSLIQVHLDPSDCSTALRRLASHLGPKLAG